MTMQGNCVKLSRIRKEGWALFLLTFLFVSCAHGKYPENLTMIPSDASMVMCLNMDQLIKKADIQSTNESGFLTFLSQLTTTQVPQLNACLNHLDQCGVNFHQPIFAFVSGPHQIGATFLLHSVSDFEKTLKSTFPGSNPSFDSFKTFSGGHYLFLPNQDSTIFVWNRHKVLVLKHTFPNQATKLFLTKEKQSIATNADFAAFYSQRQDVSCWINPQKFLNDQGYSEEGLALNHSGERCLHAFLSFNKGSINLEVNHVDSLMLNRWVNVNAHDSLLAMLPSQSLLLAHVALHPEAIISGWSAKKNVELTLWESFLRTWNGNAAISLMGFSEGDLALPQLIFLVDLKDKSGFNILINQLFKAFPHQQKEGITMVTFQMIPIYAALKNKTMLLTTSLDFAHRFMQSNIRKTEQLSHAFASAATSPIYFNLNLDFEHYPQGFNDFVQNFNMAGSLDLYKKVFPFKDVVFFYSPLHQNVTMQCYMKDSTQNSLHLILNHLNNAVASKQ